MSRRWPGGIVRKTPVTPCGPYSNSRAPGVWTLSQAEDLKKQCLWPTQGRMDAVGQTAYTTPGTYTWVVTGGITSVSVVVVASGGAGPRAQVCPCTGAAYSSGGEGGALAYRNNTSVTVGESITIKVGSKTSRSSYFRNSSTAYACGRASRIGDGGGNGGQTSCNFACTGGAGGGGAGGYSGNGGSGGYTSTSPLAGSGGGGGGGYQAGGNLFGGSGGGGVGLLGEGSNGAAGTSTSTNRGGKGGSGGGNGTSVDTTCSSGTGGYYGGGGGGGPTNNTIICGGDPGTGAVRIIWPGSTRQFPSTCTGNL